MADLITRNLTDQSQNFGQEPNVSNNGGTKSFVNNLGQPINRATNAGNFNLQNSPLDNSFQLNSNQYAVATGLFQEADVPSAISDTFGAIASVTAKSLGVSPCDVYKNGVMSQEMLANVNYFRNATSQIGYNSRTIVAPYFNNLLLGAKILNQLN